MNNDYKNDIINDFKMILNKYIDTYRGHIVLMYGNAIKADYIYYNGYYYWIIIDYYFLNNYDYTADESIFTIVCSKHLYSNKYKEIGTITKYYAKAID